MPWPERVRSTCELWRTMERMPSEYIEREDKYDVDAAFVVPDLAAALPAGATVDIAVHQLSNTYYDTAAQDLRRNRLTLRRRSGTTDTGWQLKLPGEKVDGGSARTELSVGLDGNDAVPDELIDLLTGVRRGAELKPAAQLDTQRTVHRVVDAEGALLLEVADDVVHASALATTDRSTARVTQWREVEVELGPAGSPELLAAVGSALTSAGAQASARASKLELAPGALPARPQLTAGSTVGDAVADYIDAQVAAIVAGDLGLRRGKNVVHPTRVAIRRLRSTLRTFKAVFDAGAVAEMEADLVWLAGLLGGVRDADVLKARLRALVQELAPEHVLGPVAARIDSELLADRAEHLQVLMAGMNSARMLTLLDRLEQWRVAPPMTVEAEGSGKDLRRYLRKARRKLDARLQTAAAQHARLAAANADPAGLVQATLSSEETELVHSARKAGKRFRYAAELAAPVLGENARAEARRGEELQDLLGEHQDSVVSAAALRRLGVAAGAAPGENGYTFGLLAQQELARGNEIRSKINNLLS